MAHDPLDWADRFSQARGVDADGDWAGRAMSCFVRDGLAAPPARAALDQALTLVRDSGESPQELFGDADDWAAEQVQEASLAGSDFVTDDAGLATLAVVALGMVGVMGLLWFVIALVQDGLHTQWSWSLTLAPVALGITTVTAITVRERLLRTRSAFVAWALAFAAAVPGIALTVALFVTASGHTRSMSTFVWVAQAAAAFALAWLAGRLLPDRDHRTVRVGSSASISDQQWLDELALALRERGDLTEGQVQARLDEVREHLQATGERAAAEFGNPLGYARSLPGDAVVKSRRKALWWTFLLVAYGFIHWEDSLAAVGWWRLGLLGLVAVATVHAWWRHLQARRQVGANR